MRSRKSSPASTPERGRPTAGRAGRVDGLDTRSCPPGDPGRERTQGRRARWKYSYDALVVLQEAWRLTGQPSGKYLAAIMGDTLERLVRFRELGKVQPRVSPEVLDELRAISPATIDRYLKPHKHAAYPAAGLSATQPSHILRSTIPIRAATHDPITVPRFLELDTVAHRGHTSKGEFLPPCQRPIQ